MLPPERPDRAAVCRELCWCTREWRSRGCRGCDRGRCRPSWLGCSAPDLPHFEDFLRAGPDRNGAAAHGYERGMRFHITVMDLARTKSVFKHIIGLLQSRFHITALIGGLMDDIGALDRMP